MARIEILTPSERHWFDTPPIFSEKEREKYFELDPIANSQIKKLRRSVINKVGFTLQLGYFKVTHKFFLPQDFELLDIEFVTKQLKVSIGEINFAKNYKIRTCRYHQKLILKCLNVLPFIKAKKLFDREVTRLVSKQIRGRQILISLSEMLKRKKVEVPRYDTFTRAITIALNRFESTLLSRVKESMTTEQKVCLDSLLQVGNKGKSSIRKTKLTLLKNISQSLRPAQIRESIRDFLIIQTLFHDIESLVTGLQLAPEAIKYYAAYVKKAKSFQIEQFKNTYKKYLYLAAFICHQYYLRQDTLIDIFLKSVQERLNVVETQRKALDFKNRVERERAIKVLSKSRNNSKNILKEIKSITYSPILTDAGKISQIQNLFATRNIQESDEEEKLIQQLEENISKNASHHDYYDLLESFSIKLQNRVSEITKYIAINVETSDKPIFKAIEYYRAKQGDVGKTAPSDFLSPEESVALIDDDKKFRPSLYKALLFIKMASAIKSGSLTLSCSYRYLSIDEYLINKIRWNHDKKELIEQAELEDKEFFDKVIEVLKEKTDQQYCLTNQHIKQKKNPFITFRKEERFILRTPRVDKPNTEKISELLSEQKYTPILKILSDVQELAGFVHSFKHHSIKTKKGFPSPEVFYAGILALGCNIGTKKISSISMGLQEDTLDNVIDWYFSVENLHMANKCIISLINKLSLPLIFKKDIALIHSSSDGDTFAVTTDSLNANYSFKYLRKNKGVVIYSFVDDRHVFFYSTVISASEREAAYVIDGLLHNEEIRSDIHSTDTHGFSEIVFAVTHMLGISFAPRIKRLKHQVLYSFISKKLYKEKGYKILPQRYIKISLIRENWDDILRLIATIKLKETTASQIFKRLSSYAKQNPLYQALKEFGRIIKTIFILQYIDDVELRQAIQKQLNKIELANRFSDAVFFDNNQEFQQALKEDQEVAAGCLRLIQNAVILWNYLFLTTALVNCEDPNRKNEMLDIIKNGSIVTWFHVNMKGEYDFTEHVTKQLLAFNIQKILSFKIGLSV